MIENRSQFGNDGGKAETPSDGILVWHIDATVNPAGDDFSLDNSFTSRKLIKLMRAGSSADFGASDRAAASDYYTAGREWSPTSSPSSAGYTGPTNIVLSDISSPGEFMTFQIGFQGPLPSRLHALAQDDTRDSPAIAAVSRSIGTESLRMDRIEELDETLSSAKPHEIAAAWDAAKRTMAEGAEQQQLQLVKQMIMMHWVAKDGRVAVKVFLDPENGFDQAGFARVMEAWVNSDPASAADWYFAESQNEIRVSSSLDAGNLFARKLFEFTAWENREQAIASLDSLTRSSEIVGATEGLLQAANAHGIEASQLNEELKVLKQNGQVVDAIRKLKTSIQEFQSSIDNKSDDLLPFILKETK